MRDQKTLHLAYPIARLAHRTGVSDSAFWKSFARMVKNRIFRRSEDLPAPFVTADLNGFRFYIPKNTAYVYVYQEYELLTRQTVEAVLQPGMTAVDVGANIGYFTMTMARKAGSSGRVYAVEPAPDNMAFLHKNIDANALENVTVFPCGAGDEQKTKTFYIRKSGIHHGFYANENDGRVLDTIKVRETPLDDLIEGPADLVKIDVEGAQLAVLKGMTRIMEESPNMGIIVEWDGKRDMVDYLRDRGFTLSVLKGRKTEADAIVRQYEDGTLDAGWFANLYARRRLNSP